MMMPYFSVGENKIPYVDVTYFNFAKLEGTHEYVVIPGVGERSDYEGLDVAGKVALVERGTIDFAAKQANAYEAGAIAMVCYDNVHGDLISMYDAGLLPNVFISKASGEILLAAAENGVGTLVIQPYGTETAVPNSVAGLLSDFSCWGVTPDLQLSPDVTAPGGNIYSTLTDGAYGTMSGTSMACPHIAGMSALVLQYLHDQYPGLAGEQYHIIAESLVMCTAVPAVDPDGILYSPRKQGAGAANVYSAISSPVYLTSYQKATGELTPKGSLGDDPARTGVFTFAFTMHNLTDAPQQYMLDGDLLTDQFLVIDGLEFMGETGRNLSGSVICEIPNKEKLSWDVNGDGITDKQDVQQAIAGMTEQGVYPVEM
jgi:lactocepin